MLLRQLQQPLEKNHSTVTGEADRLYCLCKSAACTRLPPKENCRNCSRASSLAWHICPQMWQHRCGLQLDYLVSKITIVSIYSEFAVKLGRWCRWAMLVLVATQQRAKAWAPSVSLLVRLRAAKMLDASVVTWGMLPMLIRTVFFNAVCRYATVCYGVLRYAKVVCKKYAKVLGTLYLILHEGTPPCRRRKI